MAKRGASAARRKELARSRIVLEHGKVGEVLIAVGYGLGALAGAVVNDAAQHAPDSPYDPYPLGEGLPRQGGALVYFNGKKILSVAGREGEPKPPRAARVSRSGGLVAIIGWGFPARFNEFGTARMAAQPFFTPAVERNFPRRDELMAPAVQAHLKAIP